LPPSFHHVHELDEGVGGARDFVLHGPTGQLEQFTGLGLRLHARHQLCQGNYLNTNQNVVREVKMVIYYKEKESKNLLVDSKQPTFDVWIKVV